MEKKRFTRFSIAKEILAKQAKNITKPIKFLAQASRIAEIRTTC
uniref:Uncharacterized protein n=1 Tax=Arundo donax TaxID=35708 RepID=A0A0A9HEN3_ARUDO